MAITPYERRSFTEIAVDTTLASGITDSDLSITISDATGWPTGSSGDFYIRIESETIRIETRSSTTLTVHADGRGTNSTTAASHSSGVAVQVVFSATDADEANLAVSKTIGKISAQGSLLIGDAANSLTELVKGTTGLPLVAGASSPGYAQLGTSGIADDAITSAKIAPDAVGASEIAADSIGTTELASAAVTTAKIAAANVTEVELAASVAGSGLAGGAGTALSVGVDNSTVEINSDALRVKAAGITASHLATSVAGNGLAGGGGTALSVGVDDSTIEISGDALRVKDAGITPAKLSAFTGSDYTPSFTSGGGSPGIGNGTIYGRYVQLGNFVWVWAGLIYGSTTNFGSGSALLFDLPSGLAVKNLGTTVVVGAGQVIDSGTQNFTIAVICEPGSDSSRVKFSLDQSIYVKGASGGLPMTWASGDSLQFHAMYETT